MTAYAGVILLDADKRVALQLRNEDRALNPGMWSVFGGHLEEGENPAEGALREIEEELSVRLTRDRLESLGQFSRGEDRYHVFYYRVEGELDAAELREGRAWRWCTLEEIQSGEIDGNRVADFHASFLVQFFQTLSG